MALKMFRTPKHSQFDYNPRFWNPQKEELEERLDTIRNRHTEADDTTAVRVRISRGFKRGGGADVDTRLFRSRQVRRSNRTLVIVLAVLILLFLWLFMMYAPAVPQEI